MFGNMFTISKCFFVCDVIPLDASLVKGSHGHLNYEEDNQPIFIGTKEMKKTILPIEVSRLIKNELSFN